MIATKLGMMSVGADRRGKPEQARRQHAGEAGHVDADAEVEAAKHPDVDAERRNRIEIARSGADAHAEARVFENREQARRPPPRR